MIPHQAPFLVASHFFIVSVSVLGVQHGCPPSSCGDLQDIRYPFSLKGVDPPACGDPRYELTCVDNKPILDFNSGKYYVESISYGNGEETIQITDIRFAAGGCALPSRTFSTDTISYDERFYINRFYSVSFINCTKEIQSDDYTHIPCLSGINASVYVVFYSRVAALAPSCRFLAMVQSNYAGLSTVHTDEAQVFDLLQNGIFLSWVNPRCGPVSSVIKDCLVNTRMELEVLPKYNFYSFSGPRNFLHRIIAPLSFQKIFFNCLDPPTNCLSNYAIFILIKIIIVLIDVVFFLVLARLLVLLVLKVLAISAFITYKFRQKQIPLDAVEKFLLNQQSITPARFAYTDIIIITRNFKDKLGQGGFGSVYKGELPGGFQGC